MYLDLLYLFSTKHPSINQDVHFGFVSSDSDDFDSDDFDSDDSDLRRK